MFNSDTKDILDNLAKPQWVVTIPYAEGERLEAAEREAAERDPRSWVSFTVPEVQYLASLILDLGEAWYQAGILQGDKKEEELAVKLTDDLIAHIKFRRKIEL